MVTHMRTASQNGTDPPDVVQTRQSIGCAGKKPCVSYYGLNETSLIREDV